LKSKKHLTKAEQTAKTTAIKTAAATEKAETPLRFEELVFAVDPGQEPMRIDLFLTGRVEKISRSRIRQVADAGLLLVNDQPVKVNYKVKPGDRVVLSMPRFHEEGPMQAEPMALDILFEDEDLLVLNKPAGLVVHPGSGNYQGTLVHGLLHHFPGVSAEEMDPERLGLVHRLDKDTSGLMVVAKRLYAAESLSRQFAERTTERLYEALCWGEFEGSGGTVTGNIGRHLRQRLLFTVLPEGEGGKHAVTHYTVLENLGYVCRVALKLETGRTHQIRVHMQHIGHPVFGDPMYGGNRIVKGTVFTKYKRFVENCFALMPRQTLHARVLGFTHPKTGERLRFEADPPADHLELIQRWRRYAGALGLDTSQEFADRDLTDQPGSDAAAGSPKVGGKGVPELQLQDDYDPALDVDLLLEEDELDEDIDQ